MTNKKRSTKRALLLSIMSMVLCVAMLAGTTFAWFTDSVTSSGNRIMSGSLEIDLLMDKEASGNYVSIADGKGDIFDEEGNGVNWEPGKTEIVYLAVENAGTLALKYNILLNVTDNGLIGSLEYAIIDGAKAADLKGVTDWATLKAQAQTGDVAAGITKAAPNGKLDAEETDYFALAVHMKEEAGNEYQNKSITIDVTVQATQNTQEEDSFDDQYDKDADYAIEVGTADALKNAIALGGNVKLTDNITVNETLVIAAGKSVVLDLNGNTIAGGYQAGSTEKHIYPINNLGDLTINGGTVEGRGIYNRDGAKITLNGTTVNAIDTNGGACVWSYGTGEVYLNNVNFTGYTGCVSSEGYVEINGGTFTCYSGIADDGTQTTSPTYNIRAYNGLTVNGGTFTSRHGVLSIGGGDVVINDADCTIKFAAATTSNVVYIFGNADVTINGGSYISDDSNDKADSGAAVLVNGSNASLTINGGTFVGMNGMVSGNANTVINAGSFNTVFDYNHYGSLEPFISDGSEATQNADGAWVVAPYTVTDAAGLKEKLAEGKNVALDADITVDSDITLGEGAVLYGNGHTLKNAQLTMLDGSTVKDVKFDGAVAANGSQIYASKVSVTVDGCEFVNGNHDAIQFTPTLNNTLVVNGCTFAAHTDASIDQIRAIHIEMDKTQDENANGIPDIAERDNGVKLILTNTHFDLTQFTTGKGSFANDMTTYGLFLENITAANNTWTDDDNLFVFDGSSFGMYYSVLNGSGSYVSALADGYPTAIIPTLALSEK